MIAFEREYKGEHFKMSVIESISEITDALSSYYIEIVGGSHIDKHYGPLTGQECTRIIHQFYNHPGLVIGD